MRDGTARLKWLLVAIPSLCTGYPAAAESSVPDSKDRGDLQCIGAVVRGEQNTTNIRYGFYAPDSETVRPYIAWRITGPGEPEDIRFDAMGRAQARTYQRHFENEAEKAQRLRHPGPVASIMASWQSKCGVVSELTDDPSHLDGPKQ